MSVTTVETVTRSACCGQTVSRAVPGDGPWICNNCGSATDGLLQVIQEGGARQWAITALAHPARRDFRAACSDCLAQVVPAVVHARVTGSTGATYGVSRDGVKHTATVSRVLGTVTL